MSRLVRAILAVAVVASLGAGFVGCGKSESGGAKKLRIGVIPKGATHEFWKSIHAGAVKAQRELKQQGTDVEIIWKGPFKEDDREQQIQVVETFISQGVNGIVLAPLDNQALTRPAEEAVKAGIPVVIIDSDLKSDKHTSFVATDNNKGGVLAAERLAELLGGKGKIILMRYQEGSASTMNREAGFVDTVKQKFPGLAFLSSDQYAGPTRESAFKTAQNLLNQFGSQLDGFFAPNETSTAGMLLAIKDAKLAGKVKCVGFDASDQSLEALKDGALQGLVLQDPLNMGYLGTKTLVAHLLGKPVEKRVDTGVHMVTKENMDHPDMARLLNPPLKEFLE